LKCELTSYINNSENIGPCGKVLSCIYNLNSLYENGNITQKRKIISLVFSEELTFDGFQFRLTRTNEDRNIFYLYAIE